jgi:hypothetical protein
MNTCAAAATPAAAAITTAARELSLRDDQQEAVERHPRRPGSGRTGYPPHLNADGQQDDVDGQFSEMQLRRDVGPADGLHRGVRDASDGVDDQTERKDLEDRGALAREFSAQPDRQQIPG